MMGEAFLRLLGWALFAFLGVQALAFVCLALQMAWTQVIKPRLIPAEDIDKVATEIIATYPDPEEEAFGRHEEAWYRGDGAEQTYWHRVRKAIRRRLRRQAGR